MHDEHPVEIPESFLALFRTPGRIKPSAPREVVVANYELCEDLANHLCDVARARHFDLGISEDEVLSRCHLGLVDGASGVDAAQALWVTRRLSELLGWGDGSWQPAP